MSTGGHIFFNFLELYIIKTEFFLHKLLFDLKSKVYFADADILYHDEKNICF